MKTQTSAIECSLARLFDYAGIFPPAALNLHAALDAYRTSSTGARAWALGSLVVDVRALHLLEVEDKLLLRELPLSVVAAIENVEFLQSLLAQAARIEMVECKAASREDILHWKKSLPATVPIFVEVPVGQSGAALLDAILEAGLHAKLRLGGVVPHAFPSTTSVAESLQLLAEKRLAFKATAGLHHALRSQHPLTYEAGSPTGWMHGFLNLLCASAHVWFGGDLKGAAQLLNESNPHHWKLTANSLRCHSAECSADFSADQLREVREHFLMSIGSCSFQEPIHDLENLGWL